MQRQVRINESQVLMLAEKAKNDHAMTGYLWKRSADNAKWKVRWFTLYQNLLFYQETSNSRVSGLIFLEGSYCERLVIASASDKGREAEKQHCFAIRFRQEGLRQYELRTDIESECELWIDAIKQASFNSLLLLKEELEQKHLHLLQIVESEKTAKWQYAQQCEEFTCEIKKLHSEVCALKKELRRLPATTQDEEQPTVEESDEIRKIKKVQSFFRGWLCRRRWKQIVEEYIHSPHAENMRKRNSLVFRMVEAEEEYVEQLQLLVACFLRPFKMAASSKTPTCTHNDVNSIFLNSETVMFLHQIFLKGLTARMESWPTLVLGMIKIGDLFDMLLPMLSIYQEYVRNHHFSLQVLAECKQNPRFVALLTRLESKASLQGRSLETFLTYPMHQIPRYIITLHELLAHTPHNHVERRSLEDARAKLEELSKQMHDEVSETENIRKNLSIERMIVEGCDLLLDVNQVYVRQGTLIQLPNEKSKSQRNPFKTSEKGAARQCFLFANHMILTTRIPGGRLHLVPTVGKVPLSDATLIEDPSEQSFLEEDDSPGSSSGESSLAASGYSSSRGSESQSLDFKLIVDVKSGPPLVVHLLAASLQEKAAWISDIIHCMDNVHFNDLFHGTVNNSSVTMPTSIRNDPRLFKDDIDIRFSRTLNSCKVPQIRYATPERLLERLTDLRFLSIDFLNTFLLTYRVFTDGVTVLEALKKVYYNPEVHEVPFYGMTCMDPGADSVQCELSPPECDNLRRISTSSVASSEPGEWDRDRALSHDSRMGIPPPQHWRWSHRKSEAYEYRRAGEEVQRKLTVSTEEQIKVDAAKVAKTSTLMPGGTSSEGVTLDVPKTPLSSTSSCDTLIGNTPDTPTSIRTSTHTLVAEDNDNKEEKDKDLKRIPSVDTSDDALSPEQGVRSPPPYSNQPYYYVCRRSVASTISSKRGSADTSTDSSLTSPRSSFQHQESPQHTSKAGVVITSHRASQRRSSTSSAAAAFAVATAGSSNPRDFLMATPRSSIGHRYSTVSVDSRQSCKDRVLAQKRESMICTAATMRVLNVLRHWVSKHSQDFESDHKLKEMTIDFLDELVGNSNLLPVEHKAATQLLRLMTKEQQVNDHVDLDLLLAPPMVPSKETFETLSALDIAEHITYLDHKIFVAIRSEEFLSQAWMKMDKMTRAAHITLITRRFNDMSRLVVSEIIRQTNLQTRVSVIEKWAAVADICRCLHNFNGVLQICSAFMNSAVFRLKKTWEKVSKTTRQTNQKLQNLVSADGRFRNLREALHRSDPPCIPYLGMYLTDLSFIEEGTPNFTEDNLLNFSKMRMVAHVIREIRHFQQTPYKIEVIAKVTNYLLDASLLIPEDVLYKKSLELEPRQSRLGSISS